VRASTGAALGILALAGVLRFTGLSWGLRHTPVRDEQDFVESAGQMIAHRDLDHRFYEYPATLPPAASSPRWAS
jgi:hypothetical protein